VTSDNIKNMTSYSEEIINYYSSSQWLYGLLCYTKDTLGMHFGFWNQNTKNRQKAILNENQAIIDITKIKKGQKILDAGCGVGGTAIYIAEKTHAKVWGISIDPNQIRLAKKYAWQRGVASLTDFRIKDFTKTNFKNNFFDVVYGIESICHAYPKSAFLKEAYRILKPGGKLIIADGYTSRKPKTPLEKDIVKKFTHAFALKELIPSQEMTKAIREAGFINIKAFDKAESVAPTVKIFYDKARIFALPAKLVSIIPFPIFQAPFRNIVALKMAGEASKTGLWAYFLHSADKPKIIKG